MNLLEKKSILQYLSTSLTAYCYKTLNAGIDELKYNRWTSHRNWKLGMSLYLKLESNKNGREEK